MVLVFARCFGPGNRPGIVHDVGLVVCVRLGRTHCAGPAAGLGFGPVVGHGLGLGHGFGIGLDVGLGRCTGLGHGVGLDLGIGHGHGLGNCVAPGLGCALGHCLALVRMFGIGVRLVLSWPWSG